MSIELPAHHAEQNRNIIWDATIGWHALRGYDFAGLDSILELGVTASPIIPLDIKDKTVAAGVCLSGSPGMSHRYRKQADSFSAYSLASGISLAVVLNGSLGGGHGGFEDEIRTLPIPPEGLRGVMTPKDELDTPLIDIKCTTEARRPAQMVAYINRTMKYLDTLGNPAFSTGQLEAIQVMADRSKANLLTDSGAYNELHSVFMHGYARILQVTRNHQPTVSDALQRVMTDRNHFLQMYVWDQNLRSSILEMNGRIVSKRTAHPQQF